jgi:hypothetical protein
MDTKEGIEESGMAKQSPMNNLRPIVQPNFLESEICCRVLYFPESDSSCTMGWNGAPNSHLRRFRKERGVYKEKFGRSTVWLKAP